MARSTILVLPVLLASGLLSNGCSSDFLPVSVLDSPRVLALIASPLEAGPGETVTLTPTDYLPPGEAPASREWSFCPFDLGSRAGFECAVPQCLKTLVPEVDGSVSSSPGDLLGGCIAGLLEGGGVPGGVPTELPERIEVTYSYRLVMADGFERRAVLRLPYYTQGSPTVRNRAPILERVEIGGQQLAPGQSAAALAAEGQAKLRIRVDPASLDSYLDSSGQTIKEEPILSFYTTAGRFEFDQAAGTDVEVAFEAEKLEGGQDQAELYVVARDLRGGQAVAGPYIVPFAF